MYVNSITYITTLSPFFLPKQISMDVYVVSKNSPIDTHLEGIWKRENQYYSIIPLSIIFQKIVWLMFVFLTDFFHAK